MGSAAQHRAQLTTKRPRSPPHLAHALKLGALAGGDAVPDLGRAKVEVVDAEQVGILLFGG
jgi:hypothetical protein